ncbi:DNA-binding domain-containing protein [Novilysobacter spongiicola]|uniref:Uncharacterized protein n=1 Tax=Lysobacter spongiicola DSM 21749 TaxID=1122188 RepID=A0A1T4MXI8_9GAMM|nr:putative DNA-binding domain-containing protein [Lysobacter spongiicola]SJZ71564.1 hypothetical protein SAMN02745674_00633 [Lysobacter spongiicola DSM 21749]
MRKASSAVWPEGGGAAEAPGLPPADPQSALAAHIRDPVGNPAPAGIEARRLAIYRELFFKNIESMLAGNFPVIRRILAGDTAGDKWAALVRDFYRDHPARTPLFPRIAREFVDYLEARVVADDPPWLAELAHYEWMELALQISEVRIADHGHEADGDLLRGAPLPSPLAWPLAYAWPVHRLGPDFLPGAEPTEPTFLLLQRDAAGKVHFQQLSALTFRLLQRLEEAPTLDGEAQLRALAVEATAPDVDAFLEQGALMLQRLRADGVILGTRAAADPAVL